jgi:hypothetical protein
MALFRSDIDWGRGRLHVQRTWSEKGGRIEDCKDGDDRWVKIASPAALEALRGHCEAMDLEAQVRGWDAVQRRLVFPNTFGRIPRFCTFVTKFWRPLLTLARLPYRSFHSTRHSYATWMLEAGADLRYVKDQLGHASIDETEGTYGHLERRRHEEAVNLDGYLDAVTSRQSASQPAPPPALPHVAREPEILGNASYFASLESRAPASRRTSSLLGKQKRILVAPSSGWA